MVALPVNDSPSKEGGAAQAAAGTGAGIIATTTKKGRARGRKRASVNTVTSLWHLSQHLGESTLGKRPCPLSKE
jgi:hypothetical protein